MRENELTEMLERIEVWKEAEGYQKTIDEVEAIPEEERSYAQVLMLASAYSGLAPDGDSGAPLLEKAVELLQSIEEEGQDDSHWHFEMGYALFYLDREEEALPCFQKAAKMNPEDTEALEYIEECERYIAESNESEYQKTIDEIEAIPEEERSYAHVLMLASAYSGLAPGGDSGAPLLEKAVELLQSIEEEGQDDSRWHFEMGYALFYLDREEEALPCFQKAAKMNPEDTEALEYIEECRRYIAESSEPELYDGEEMEAVEKHIARYFGEFEGVLHEIVSPDIHVDICAIPPTPERNYYTLVTMGMGAHRMNVPEELAKQQELDPEEFAYAELLITLPPDWKLDQESMQDEKWYWPIRLLKSVARMPGQQDTWLGWGHTVASNDEETYAENTKLCSVILLLTDPEEHDEDADICELPNGKVVNFYQLIPLYREELEYKLENGGDKLVEKLESVSHVVDINRPNVMKKEKTGM